MEKGWIWLSKSLVNTLILFVPKLNEIIRLYVDYRSLNKVIIKNCYLLPLVSEMLNRLSKVKIFTKLDL